MRFWISWVQKTEDYRPINYPPNSAILGWWKSGIDSNDRAILCACVEAESQDAAEKALCIEWPENERSSRFFDQVADDYQPGDRFPQSDWMKPRFVTTPASGKQ